MSPGSALDTSTLEPIDASVLRVVDGTARLLASRCPRCHATSFPPQASCQRCTGEETDVITLPAKGTLWSYTVQRFEPKLPYNGPTGSDFRPYGVGYVELGDVIVEGLLNGTEWHIGQTMRVVPRVWVPRDGNRSFTFAFDAATREDGTNE